MDLRIGDTVAGYRIEAHVGEGGMGAVYRAVHLRLDRTVALKILSLDRFPEHQRAEMRSRFFLEASVSSKLVHPNIVTVHDVGEIDARRQFIAMELIDGVTLETHLEHHRRLPAAEAIRIAYEVAKALRVAHARGVVHRDLKPGNLMLHGEELALKVVDFGLVKDLHAPRITQQGNFLGTIGYLAPETFGGGEVDHRVDLYALGVVLYECLTGKAAFANSNPMQTMMAVTTGPAPRVRDTVQVSAALDELVFRLMSKRPDDRIGSASELARQLLELPEANGRLGVHPQPADAARRARPQTGVRFQSATTYQIGEAIERGDDGLRKAANLQLGTEVLLQVLPSLPSEVLHGIAEHAKLWNQVQHPNLAPVADLGNVERDGLSYGALIYRTRARATLATQLERSGPMRSELIWSLCRQLFGALTVIHERGLVHGRLSPSAVLVDGGTLELRPPAGLPFDEWAPWSAPEARPSGIAAPVDVFAAAMVILTSLDPADQRRGSSKELTPLVHILSGCLTDLPESRPTARAVKDRLEAMAPRKQAVVWVLGEDPVFASAPVQQGRRALERVFAVVDVASSNRDVLAEAVRQGALAPPAAIVFGDRSVLQDDPLLRAVAELTSTGRVLLSSSPNVEVLQRSINFCGVDRHLTAPASGDEVFLAASTAIRSAPRPALPLA